MNNKIESSMDIPLDGWIYLLNLPTGLKINEFVS